jgi:hypothetical protein
VAVFAGDLDVGPSGREALHILGVDRLQRAHARIVQAVGTRRPGCPVAVQQRLTFPGLEIDAGVRGFFAGPHDLPAGHEQQVTAFDEMERVTTHLGPLLVGAGHPLISPCRRDGRAHRLPDDIRRGIHNAGHEVPDGGRGSEFRLSRPAPGGRHSDNEQTEDAAQGQRYLARRGGGTPLV